MISLGTFVIAAGKGRPGARGQKFAVMTKDDS
jgi:hypothetical protein